MILDQRPLPVRWQSSDQGHEAVVEGFGAVVIGCIPSPGVYAYQRTRSHSFSCRRLGLWPKKRCFKVSHRHGPELARVDGYSAVIAENEDVTRRDSHRAEICPIDSTVIHEGFTDPKPVHVQDGIEDGDLLAPDGDHPLDRRVTIFGI